MLQRSLIPVLTSLLLAGSLGAQTPAADTTALLGPRPAPFLALSVADLDRQLAWYRDTLGFQVYSEGVAPNGTIRFALLQQGQTLLELLQLPDAKPLGTAAPGIAGPYLIHGFFKSGFVVADIDAVYRRIVALGIRLAYDLGQPPNGPFRSFGIRDPEGNLLQFFGR